MRRMLESDNIRESAKVTVDSLLTYVYSWMTASRPIRHKKCVNW